MILESEEGDIGSLGILLTIPVPGLAIIQI